MMDFKIQRLGDDLRGHQTAVVVFYQGDETTELEANSTHPKAPVTRVTRYRRSNREIRPKLHVEKFDQYLEKYEQQGNRWVLTFRKGADVQQILKSILKENARRVAVSEQRI